MQRILTSVKRYTPKAIKRSALAHYVKGYLSERKRLASINLPTSVYDRLIDSLVQHPRPTGWTDVDFILGATQSALNMDHERFADLLAAKQNDLRNRANQFLDDYSNERLFGWCKTVQKVSGHFNLANKYFLEYGGVLFDDAKYVTRMTHLIELGINELERRFGSCSTFDEWLLRHDNTPQVVARDQLRQALNYVGRYANSFQFFEVFEDEAMRLIEPRFDLTFSLFSTAMLPFPKRGRVLSHVESTINEVLKRISSRGGKTAFDEMPQRHQRAVLIVAQNLTQQSRFTETLTLAKHVNISTQKALSEQKFSSFAEAHLQTTESLDYLLSEFAKTPFQNRFDRIIVHIRILGRSGRLKELHNAISQIKSNRKLSFLQISQICRTVEAYLPANQQAPFVLQAKRALTQLSQSKAALGNENFVWRTVDLERMTREIKVVDEFNQVVEKLIKWRKLRPQNGKLVSGDKIVLFAMTQDRVSPLVLAPILPILQRNGFKFFNLLDDGFTNSVVRPWAFSPQLTPNFEATVENIFESNKLLNKWDVRPEECVISCEGVNYYQGFYERVARVLKVSTVDWSLPSAVSFLRLWLRQSDRLIAALEATKDVLRDTDARATLVSLQSQFAPYFVMKKFSEANAEYFSHVKVSSSYENWASNFGGKPVSSLTLLNTTTHDRPSAPAFGRTDDFEDWYQGKYRENKDSYDSVTRRHTGIARSGDLTDDARILLKRISDLKRSKSRSVFCALGKIPYDFNVPYQGGPAHANMKDWLNHTISIAEESGDILLIKPHPHEMNFEISHKPNETFLDLIDQDTLPDNVILLPYRGIGLQALLSVVDVFLCWNGSSIAELGSQGARVVAADDWAARNYPVKVKLPRNRDDFEQLLRDSSSIKMHPEFEERCRAYLAYMTEAPFALRYPIVGRSPTNTNFNQAWVNWDCFTKEKLKDLDQYERFLVETFEGIPHAVEEIWGPSAATENERWIQ